MHKKLGTMFNAHQFCLQCHLSWLWYEVHHHVLVHSVYQTEHTVNSELTQILGLSPHPQFLPHSIWTVQFLTIAVVCLQN
jgi:hypothetical protein